MNPNSQRTTHGEQNGGEWTFNYHKKKLYREKKTNTFQTSNCPNLFPQNKQKQQQQNTSNHFPPIQADVQWRSFSIDEEMISSFVIYKLRL